MKTYWRFLLVFFLLATSICSNNCIVVANPIVPPPMFSEIYFSEEGWQIEMIFQAEHGLTNLDNVRLVCDNGYAAFNAGIAVIPGEVMIITNDDLLSSLEINPLMDEVYLEEYFGGNWYQISFENLCWGFDPPDAWVRAPGPDESIAMQVFTIPYTYNWTCWTVLEAPHSIGNNPHDVNKRAIFEGYVFDMNGIPLTNVWLKYCSHDPWNYLPQAPYLETDEDGYFYTGNMHCKTFTVQFYHGGESWGDTIVNIETDSINSHIYYLDGVFSDFVEREESAEFHIKTFPNPASDAIILRIEHDGGQPEGVIKFFGADQTLFMEVPVKIWGEKTDLRVELNDRFSPGPCFYLLEIDNFTVATGKMIIIR